MIKLKVFDNFNKKKIALIALLITALLFILGKNYNWVNEVVKSPSVRIQLINIAKVAIPLKNLILMRDVDDKIALLKSSGSCVFCDLTQGDFKGNDLKRVDLRYANLSGSNLNEANLQDANLSGANLSGVDLSNKDLTGTILLHANLSGANLEGVDLRNKDLTGTNLSGVDLRNKDLTGTILLHANLSGANLEGVDLSNKDLTGTILLHANLSGANLEGVDLRNKDLTGTNLSGVDLRNKDLTGTILLHANLSGANLEGVDLSNKDLTGANLSGVDLRNKDLTGTNLSGVDLRNKDLTGTILLHANLSGANLEGVDLRNKDLTGANLSGVDLRNKDFTGANLSGVDLRNKDLTGTNLSGVDLRNKDLTGTILKDAKKIEMSVKNLSNSNWPALNEIQNLSVTRYDLVGDVQYLATREGFLFESKNNESKIVLDLNNDPQFIYDWERGLLGVASKNNLVYVSYTTQDNNEPTILVVDEYSMNFSKVRNIIKIRGFQAAQHFGGSLLFDNLGKLYLSVGDGAYQGDLEGNAQNLNDYRGTILRLDISDLKLEPEIVAYGIRNPWGVTIDSKDRMFISQCGWKTVEAVYLLNDLYSGIPANLGWPVFEGSIRMKEDPLMFNDLLAPIFEYTNRPGCVTAGVYLNDIELLLLADLYGAIRLLKQKENGEWYLFHEYKQEEFIWGFGLDEKTKKIFVAPNNYELEILVEQVKLNQ